MHHRSRARASTSNRRCLHQACWRTRSPADHRWRRRSRRRGAPRGRQRAVRPDPLRRGTPRRNDCQANRCRDRSSPLLPPALPAQDRTPGPLPGRVDRPGSASAGPGARPGRQLPLSDVTEPAPRPCLFRPPGADRPGRGRPRRAERQHPEPATAESPYRSWGESRERKPSKPNRRPPCRSSATDPAPGRQPSWQARWSMEHRSCSTQPWSRSSRWSRSTWSSWSSPVCSPTWSHPR